MVVCKLRVRVCVHRDSPSQSLAVRGGALVLVNRAPRAARRYVNNVVGTELGRFIIDGTIKPGSVVTVDTDAAGTQLQFRVSAHEAATRPTAAVSPPSPEVHPDEDDFADLL